MQRRRRRLHCRGSHLAGGTEVLLVCQHGAVHVRAGAAAGAGASARWGQKQGVVHARGVRRAGAYEAAAAVNAVCRCTCAAGARAFNNNDTAGGATHSPCSAVLVAVGPDLTAGTARQAGGAAAGGRQGKRREGGTRGGAQGRALRRTSIKGACRDVSSDEARGPATHRLARARAHPSAPFCCTPDL